MDLARRDPKARPPLAGDPGEERGRIMGVEPIQRPSPAVVAQLLDSDARAQEIPDRRPGQRACS
jgi:hypothetical protein